MAPPSTAADRLATLTHRNLLLHLHARALAHEISNLMFLAEIQARSAHPAAEGEIRRALPVARRLARLLADALAPEPKLRIVSLAEVFEEIDALVIAPSKGQLPPCTLRITPIQRPLVDAARFQEVTASVLLVIQDLLRQAAALPPPGSVVAPLRIDATATRATLTLVAKAPHGSLLAAGFVDVECRRNGINAAVAADGSVVLTLPLVSDDEGLD
jgi:hypothetical protein